MKVFSSYSTIVWFLSIIVLICIATIKGNNISHLPLNINVNTVFISQRDTEVCPTKILHYARETLRSEMRNLIQDSVEALIEMRSRVCECGYAGAGWRRVVFLNITNTDQNCPGEWQLITSPRRTCRRAWRVNSGCSLAAFSTDGVSYSDVCGRIIGYQYGSTDALYGPTHGRLLDQASINYSLYDGGVLITHGTAPRQHIWSLVGGNSQQAVSSYDCPCNIGSTLGRRIPSWLGEDYFCDSATITPSVDYTFYTKNPLWDGAGCDESSTTCCQFNNPPWFCKQLAQPTSDDIELRLCADSPTEATPIEFIEIYVR